jgi:hypothetical protein
MKDAAEFVRVARFPSGHGSSRRGLVGIIAVSMTVAAKLERLRSG